MQLAIFGIENDGLNLAANLFVLMLVVLWLALIAYTYFDARRRISDPVLVLCATAASLFPFIGTAVYAILRPPEYLEDAREREIEMQAAELRVRQLSELSCPNCDFPVEKTYLRCPNCQRRLKDPCQSCGKPVDPRWALCPYCETTLPGRTRRQPQAQDRRAPSARAGEDSPPQRQRPARRAPAEDGTAEAPEPRSARPAARPAESAPPPPRRQREQPARASRTTERRAEDES
jgi:hypothetical protein